VSCSYYGHDEQVKACDETKPDAAAKYLRQLFAEPGLGQSQFATDHVNGERECLRRLFRSHPAEVTHLDQLDLQRIRLAQFFERLIDQQ
jgi:hypothetical protein